MRKLLLAFVVALVLAAPAAGYYNDGGSGGNQPDCTATNIGDWFGNWVCVRDPFSGATDWWWGG